MIFLYINETTYVFVLNMYDVGSLTLKSYVWRREPNIKELGMTYSDIEGATSLL